MFDSNRLIEINKKQLSEHQRNWSWDNAAAEFEKFL